MKTRFLSVSSILAVALLIAGTLIIGADAATKTVSPENRLSIAQPKESGQWKAYDLTIEYTYSRNQGHLDLSGNVRFASYLTLGYARLDNFRLGAVFLDENGKVLQEIGLTTNRGSLEPISFNRKIDLPQNAVYMAFSYDGKAISAGGMGAGPITFTFYPIH